MTSLRVQLIEPLVCRSPGLSFDRIAGFGADAQREALWKLLDDGKFLDCLATIHHGALPSLRSRRAKFRPDRRASNQRRAELTLYRYLARFCSRNDTTGTAGTTIWGKLADETELVLAETGGKTRVVFTSPRHAELLCHRAAYGPLRDRATLLLHPCYGWTQGELFDVHSGGSIALTGKEKEVVGWVASSGARYADLDARQRATADALIAREVLTLRVGRPNEDRMAILLELSKGTELQDDVQHLGRLQRELSGACGDEFARLMQEADEVAARVAPCEALSFPHVLRHLVLRALADAALEVVLCPQWKVEEGALVDVLRGMRRPSSNEECAVAGLSQGPMRAVRLAPLRAQLAALLDEGIVTLAGAVDHRPGWPWRVRFGALTQALAAFDLAEPLRDAARLLRQAALVDPLQLNPVEAEARLAKLFTSDQTEVWQPGLDRSFLISDSVRKVERFTLGGALKQRLETELAAFYRLAAWFEFCRDRALRPRLRQLLPRGESVPLARLLDDLRAFERQDDLWALVREPAENDNPWRVEGDPRTMCVSLKEEVPNEEFDRWLQDKRLVCTLDVMFGGSMEQLKAGQGTILIAEGHAGSEGLGETTFFPQAHPEYSLKGHGRQVFGDDMLFIPLPISSKQSEGVLLQLQDVVLGVKNAETWWPQQRSVPIARLMATRRADGVYVHDGENEYRFINNALTVGNIRTVGFPPMGLATWVCGMAGFQNNGPLEIYPEVRLGSLALTRWTLRLPAAAALKVLVEKPGGTTLRAALCLPRFTFVKTRRKPMLCDLDSPFGLEVLAAELAKGEMAAFSPMQPAPEELWLKLEDGPYTSELRMATLCDGPAFDAGSGGRVLPL